MPRSRQQSKSSTGATAATPTGPGEHRLLSLQAQAGNAAVCAHVAQRLVVQRDTADVAAGRRDAVEGRPKGGAPRAGAAMADYNRGFAEGLDERLRDALSRRDWPTAALVLNAFNVDDIIGRIARVPVQDLMEIERAAFDHPRLSRHAQVGQVIHDMVEATVPGAYPGPQVFPNNFGDRLGPVGGAVIAAAGGVLALRLAAPLLAGWWRTIAIRVGMTRALMEGDREHTRLMRMELGRLIERLMNGPGGRVLVTYQTDTPAAGVELYLTQQGSQYAQAVAAGRNLYQLRIPEQLYQILVSRGEIVVRTGSMAGQVGDDIRISPGAMAFLSQYFRQIPLGGP
ncbi:hypothetical protein LFM09_48995 [Lentzea alba]|uniref:hypothetical protein n=1 Tax=Lentzea alba TaxID=2714351 RepID=UPI0039BF4FD4